MASHACRAPQIQQFQWAFLLILVMGTLVLAAPGVFLEPPPSFSLRALTDEPAQLPCLVQVDRESVVQVSWSRELPDGTKQTVITAHRTDGQEEFAPFSGRVRFQSVDPMSDAALVIQSTRESDEGRYTCHVTTFPSGNFERQMSLIVWSLPISSVEPEVLVEGQSSRLAATCRSVARPLPALSWDTDLVGQSYNRTLSSGAISVIFHVEPLRSMNGARLDCLVWHPLLEQPRRITNRLVVHYPPEAAISGYEHPWYVGLKQASLRCSSSGNPKPLTVTWSRKGGTLPEGASVQGEVLQFHRPLLQTDAGVYECIVNNGVGVDKDSVPITVTDVDKQVPIFQHPVVIIGACAAAGALLANVLFALIVVRCRYKQKEKKLKKELNEKREELVSLSRENSIRRLNSFSSDPRIQMDDNMPLRPGSAVSSLRDFPGRTYSTCSGTRRSRGGDVLETAARSDLRSSTLLREDQEEGVSVELDGAVLDRRLRPGSFLKNSNMSLAVSSVTAAGGLQRLGSRDHLSLVRTSVNGAAGLQPLGVPVQRSSVIGTATVQRASTGSPAQSDESWEGMDEGEEDGESTTNSSQITEAINSHFYYSNGGLRPKRHPNSIIIDHNGQIILGGT